MISGRPAAALVVDTSGSISDKDLALALAIIKNATSHADLTIYACDTEATRVNRLAPGCMVGGGGTDMMNGIRAALAGKPKPFAVVVITDCYSPWDATAPEVPVVILTSNPAQAPAWAKVVTIEGGF
jgi:predicted metal-dependent peptidase